MHKYEISKFDYKIKKIEIEKETEKTIWIKDKWNSGNNSLTQCRKDSEWNKYFDTFQDAKNYLIDKCENKIKSLNEKINKENENLKTLIKLTEKGA